MVEIKLLACFPNHQLKHDETWMIPIIKRNMMKHEWTEEWKAQWNNELKQSIHVRNSLAQLPRHVLSRPEMGAVGVRLLVKLRLEWTLHHASKLIAFAVARYAPLLILVRSGRVGYFLFGSRLLKMKSLPPFLSLWLVRWKTSNTIKERIKRKGKQFSI